MSEEEKEVEKKVKKKKRPSDFEIVRSILQRTTDRRAAKLLKNMGEDNDLLFMCNQEEDGFLFGSSEITVTMVSFTDPELKTMADTVLDKIYGYKHDHQIVINIKDQLSELSKTKGEKIDCEVQQNDYGTCWVDKVTEKSKKTLYLCKAVDSFYHFEVVKHWNDLYRRFLDGDDEDSFSIPYTYDHKQTSVISHFDISHYPSLFHYFPDGIRLHLTKGIDVLLSKNIIDLPYPVLNEEIIIFKQGKAAFKTVHRINGQGWRMIIFRPNAILFPTSRIALTD